MRIERQGDEFTRSGPERRHSRAPIAGGSCMTGGRSAVVLAAGASTRMAGRPKALLDVGGELAVNRLVRLCREEGFEPRVVVGRHGTEIRSALSEPVPEVVENPDWARGRTGSVQRGLEGLSPRTSVLVWPVDHPFVQAMTLRRLCTAAEHDAMGVWFLPTFEGAGGHPILVQPLAVDAIRGLEPDTPLRVLIARLGPQVVRVPCDDPGVCANIDTDDAYRQYLARVEQRRNLA